MFTITYIILLRHLNSSLKIMDRDIEQAPKWWKHNCCKHENLQEATFIFETKYDA